MTFTHIQDSAVATTAASGTLTITLSSTVAGNLLTASVAVNSSTVPAAPSGWTLRKSVTQSTTACSAIYDFIGNTGGITSVAFTVAARSAGIAQEWQPQGTPTPDASGTAGTTTLSATTNIVTSGNLIDNHELAISMLNSAANASLTLTQGAGFTQAGAWNQGAGSEHATFDYELNTGSSSGSTVTDAVTTTSSGTAATTWAIQTYQDLVASPYAPWDMPIGRKSKVLHHHGARRQQDQSLPLTPPDLQVTAGLATGTGTAFGPDPDNQASGTTTAGGTGSAPGPGIGLQGGSANSTGAASGPGIDLTPALATGTGTAFSPDPDNQTGAGLASGTGTAFGPTASSGGAFTFVGATTTDNANGATTATINLPSGVQGGDLVVTYLVFTDGTAPQTVTMTGYTTIFSNVDGNVKKGSTTSFGNSMSLGYRTAGGTFGNATTDSTYTLTFNTTAWSTIITEVFRGPTATWVLVGSGKYNAASSQVTALPDAVYTPVSAANLTVWGWGGQNTALSGTETLSGTGTTTVSDFHQSTLSGDGGVVGMGWMTSTSAPGGATSSTAVDPTDIAAEFSNTAGAAAYSPWDQNIGRASLSRYRYHTGLRRQQDQSLPQPFLNVTAGLATATGTAQSPGLGLGGGSASSTGAASGPGIELTPALAAGTGIAFGPGIGLQGGSANSTGASFGPGIELTPSLATGTGTAFGPDPDNQASGTTVAAGTGSAFGPGLGLGGGSATSTGAAQGPGIELTPGIALGTGTAFDAVASGSLAVLAPQLVTRRDWHRAYRHRPRQQFPALPQPTIVTSSPLIGSGFGTFPQVPAGAIILSVVADVVWFASDAQITAPRYELWDGTNSALGTALGVPSTVAGYVDSVVFAGPVLYSQLATLQLRIYANSQSGNSGATVSVDAVSLAVVWTPNTNATVTPGTLATITAFPAVSVSTGFTATVGLATATGTAFNVTATRPNDALINPATLAVVPAFPAPAISTGFVRTPGIATATGTAFGPVAGSPNDAHVLPSPLSVTAAFPAPTVTVGVVRTPQLATATGTAFNPVAGRPNDALISPVTLAPRVTIPTPTIMTGTLINASTLAVVPALPLIIDVTGPGWAGAETDGGWTNPQNVTGSPDGSYAVWTVP